MMYFRWTLQCADQETGKSSLQTYVAQDEQRAISEASYAGYLVEKVIHKQPLDAQESEIAPEHEGAEAPSLPDAVEIASLSTQEAINRAKEIVLPLSILSNVGIAGCFIGLILLVPAIAIAFSNIALGIYLAGISGFLIWHGLLLIAAMLLVKSICLCLLILRDHESSE